MLKYFEVEAAAAYLKPNVQRLRGGVSDFVFIPRGFFIFASLSYEYVFLPDPAQGVIMRDRACLLMMISDDAAWEEVGRSYYGTPPPITCFYVKNCVPCVLFLACSFFHKDSIFISLLRAKQAK